MITKLRGIRNLIPLSKKKYLFAEMFDRWVSKDLDKKADIIICQDALALHRITKAKQLGIISILDYTGPHIEHHIESMVDEYNRFGIKHKLYFPLEVIQKVKKSYEEADYISVVSSYAKRTFMDKNIPEAKLLLIHLGIDLDNFYQTKKEDKTFRIIFCGHSCIRKGTHYLLEAFSSLKLRNAELWLIGHVFEDIKEFLKKYEGYYKIIGYIKNNELYKYYSQGSVFILPSLTDAFGMVILEAMACGLPVIATENTGARDVINDKIDGFIIPVRDAESLKKKIIYMYENQNICEQMGQNAKEKIKQQYTIEHYAERMIAAFNKLL